MRRFLIIVGVLATHIIVGAGCFIVGAISGNLQVYQNLTDAKLAKIEPILREPRFAGIEAEYSSAAKVYLVGTVDSQQSYDSLEQRLRLFFGDEEAKYMMGNLNITEPRGGADERL